MKFEIIAVTLVSVCLSMAQEARPSRGEIRSDLASDLSWLTVKIDPLGPTGHGESAPVTPGGEFELPHMPVGLYTLRIVDSQGNELVSQQITLGPANPTITVKLPGEKAVRPSGETTSVARLRHKPTKRALQAAVKAQRFSESHKYDRAAIEWKKAVDEDPDFSEAHTNLGAQYVRLQRLREAAEEFRKAIALDPDTARHQSNLAVALAQLNQIDEAEKWARQAVQKDGSNALGHYVLGCILTARTNTLREAIQQLTIAARELPQVHQKLAEIYLSQGKKSMATAEMNQYQEATRVASDHNTAAWSSPLH